MASASPRCSAKFCRKQAEGNSPITDQLYCAQHLQTDLSRCEKSQTAVMEKIALLKKYQAPLRLMQQRLASDLQLLDDYFTDLRETLIKCQVDLIADITEHHDQLIDSLGILTELEDFETELKTAKDSNNMKQAFLITENMEKSLETLDLDSDLACMDEEINDVKLVAFPDVCSSVLDLHSVAKTQLDVACRLIKHLDVRCKGKPNLFEPVKKINSELVGSAVRFVTCDDTSGLVLDASGSIVRTQAAAECRELPQPAAFVAVEHSKAGKESGREIDNKSEIITLSADGSVTGRVSSCWDAGLPIRDLHCDSDRQLLFIAQDQAVTVANLCGIEKTKIKVSDLQDDVKKLCCITGDFDKLYILAERVDSKPMIFGLSKKSNEVQLKLAVAGIEKAGDKPRISVRDRMLYFDDGEKLHTVCTITGVLLSSVVLKEASFFSLIDSVQFRDKELMASFLLRQSSAKKFQFFQLLLKRPTLPNVMPEEAFPIETECTGRTECTEGYYVPGHVVAYVNSENMQVSCTTCFQECRVVDSLVKSAHCVELRGSGCSLEYPLVDSFAKSAHSKNIKVSCTECFLE